MYYCEKCKEWHTTSDDIDWEERKEYCDKHGHVKNCVADGWCAFCARKVNKTDKIEGENEKVD